jgi:hypothetical protein
LKAKPQIQILKGGQIKININEVENNIAGETK